MATNHLQVKMLPYSQDSYSEAEEAVKCAAGSLSSPLTLEEAIKSSQAFLLSRQFPEGYWWGALEANASATSHTVLLYKILGIEDKCLMKKMEKYLRRIQCSHGGWEIFYGDGGYLSATIEAYMALRLLNVPRTDPALRRALKFIIARGGVAKSQMLTKILLALLGCFDWSGIPSLPPWIMLLPSWFPLTIYDTAYWARGCMVPLVVICDRKPVFKVSPEVSFNELYAEGREHACRNLTFHGGWISNFFIAVDRVFKAMESLGAVPFRKWGLREAEKWLLERQEDTGDFTGIYPPMFYSVVCMITLGYAVTDPVAQRALQSIKNFSIETADECWVQCSLSPVWDTALVLRALLESGMPPDHPALQKAGEWLLQKQITKRGDWSFKNPDGLAGGWAFEFFNRWYPDVDDTAEVIMALHALKLPDEDVKHGAIVRGMKWISSMQCKGGGWAAFEKDNYQHWINSTPFSDLNATIDPSTTDVTARVLEMVGTMKLQGTTIDEANFPSAASISRGLAYLQREQEKEGCWIGRWAVNYIFGTSHALQGLAMVAPTTHAEEIARGARWLVEVQNMQGKKANGPEDGGWGETCFSYNDPALKGQGDASTASQTAWALQGLLAAGDALGKYEVEAIEQGVRYLLSTQRKDGSWHEAQFTGCGFPNHFYLRYHLYAQHFTLSALARYRDRLKTSKIEAPNYSIRV